jgi:hypothetical protein
VKDLHIIIDGDSDYAALDLDGDYPLGHRVADARYDIIGSTSNVTGTAKMNYEIAAEGFEPVMEKIRELINEFEVMDTRLGDMGAPLTPGRLPDWRRE